MSASERRPFPTPKELFGAPTEADLQRGKEQARDAAYNEVREYVEQSSAEPERLRIVSDYASLLDAQTTLAREHFHLPVSKEDVQRARIKEVVVGERIRTREEESPSYLATMKSFTETFAKRLIQAEVATLRVDNELSRLDAQDAVVKGLSTIRTEYIARRNVQSK